MRAYEQAQPAGRRPKEDDFRSAPAVPRAAACRAATSARVASVALFKVIDASKLTLTEPELVAKNAGRPVLMLDDPAKMAIEKRARSYEQDAALYEPSCLG